MTPDVFTSGLEESQEEEDEHQREIISRQWKMKMHQGEWLPGVSAGGCRNFLGNSSEMKATNSNEQKERFIANFKKQKQCCNLKKIYFLRMQNF